MYICVCITKQQQITFCMVEIQYLTAKVQKLLQWCSCFKTVISWQPLGWITWPRDQSVAKGLYSIWSHQSEVGGLRLVIVTLFGVTVARSQYLLLYRLDMYSNQVFTCHQFPSLMSHCPFRMPVWLQYNLATYDLQSDHALHVPPLFLHPRQVLGSDCYPHHPHPLGHH